MAIAPDDAGADSYYACSCLNIRVQAFTPSGSAAAPEYLRVKTTESQIHMTNPALTVRVRTRGSALNSHTWAQHTSLTCLVCGMLVYRVYQEAPTSMAGKEGPVRPREDWIEDEVLFSSTGWIEISSRCLTGEAIRKAEQQEQFSSIYSILVSVPPSTQGDSDIVLGPPTTTKYLSHLPPLIEDTPFTPNHAVFGQLSEKAQAKSDAIRRNAERDISEIVREKSRQIAKQEAQLRAEMHTLWNTYRENMSKTVAAHRNAAPPLSPSTQTEPNSQLPVRAKSPEPSNLIREFRPSKVAPRESSATPPRMSSLSASLATSTFHHPKAQDEQSSSPGSTLSVSSIDTPANGTQTLLSYRRNNDETSDAATSYKYWRNMEEEMTRHKERQQTENRVPTIPENEPVPKAISSDKDSAEVVKPDASKTKRKVTFQDKLDNEQKEKRKPHAMKDDEDGDDMMFPLEGEDGSSQGGNNSPSLQLPLLEQPSVTNNRPDRSRPRRQFDTTGLPASFSGLRPISLPVLSQVRKPVGTALTSPVAGDSGVGEDAKDDVPLQDAEVVRLTSPSTPTHKAQRKKSAPAQQKLLAKPPGKDSDETDSEEELIAAGVQGRWQRRGESAESSETDLSKAGIPGSIAIPSDYVPQPVTGPGQQEEALMASYRPENGVAQRSQNDTLRHAAMRRQQYAERDRARASDPGEMDFVVEEGEEEVDEDEEEGDLVPGMTEGDRKAQMESGRKHALKILQARNKLPEAGMWRSLA